MDYAAVVGLEIVYMIAFLALISAGLAVVFGMMRVINLAHGEFVMLGGYTTIAAAKAGINIYFAMLVLSPLALAIFGLIVERLIVRHLYGRMIDTMLATWGLSLLMVGLVTLIFGNTPVSVPAPISGYAARRATRWAATTCSSSRWRCCWCCACGWCCASPAWAWWRAARCRAPTWPRRSATTRSGCTCGPSPPARRCRAWPAACWRRSPACCRPRAGPTSPRPSSPSSPAARR